MSVTLAIVREANELVRPGNELDYLPFGVKTIKLVVEGDYAGQLYLRPERLSRSPTETLGHEDEGEPPQFIVSWGGGHEAHYTLTYPAKRHVHFLVHHVGDGVGDYRLTIVAENENGRLTHLPITLTYPRIEGDPWPSDQLLRPAWQEVTPGLDGSCDIRLNGRYPPYYLSRWWPENRVRFSYDQLPPQIWLRLRRRVDGDNGDVTAYVTPAGGGEERPLATVTGSIGYPLYDMRQILPELYRFGPQTWVLRIWFFWLDLAPSQDRLGYYWPRTEEELAAAWRGISSVADGGTAARRWRDRHEIPDAERLDILFDGATGRPLFVATDLHWREMWGRFERPDAPVEAVIMNTRAGDLLGNWRHTWEVVRGWSAIILSRFARGTPPFKPHLEVRAELAGASLLAADPIALESHSPAFLNVRVERRFTSTDVTDG